MSRPDSYNKLSPKLTDPDRHLPLNLLGHDSVPEAKEPGTTDSTQMKQESLTRDAYRDTSIQMLEMANRVPEMVHDESRLAMLDIKARAKKENEQTNRERSPRE